MDQHQREVQAGGLTLIAEAATCHGGDYITAWRMVNAAYAAGATHVKFQHVDPSHFKPGTVWRGHDLREWFEQARLSPHELSQLKTLSELAGLKFLCTPQTVMDFQELVSIGIEEVKISSDNLTNHELLEAVNGWGGGVYLSTGMSGRREIVKATNALRDCNTRLLACTSEYPCPPDNVNLSRLTTAPNGRRVHGFSDHTRGVTAALVALGLGARVFEKHFYLESAAYGPDADPSFAMSARQLKTYFSALKRGYRMLGHGRWEPTPGALKAKEAV